MWEAGNVGTGGENTFRVQSGFWVALVRQDLYTCSDLNFLQVSRHGYPSMPGTDPLCRTAGFSGFELASGRGSARSEELHLAGTHRSHGFESGIWITVRERGRGLCIALCVGFDLRVYDYI